MEKYIGVLAMVLKNRAAYSTDVQNVLSKYGSSIIMRNGLPYPDEERGIITLLTKSTPEQFKELGQELSQIDGVSLKNFILEEQFN